MYPKRDDKHDCLQVIEFSTQNLKNITKNIMHIQNE